MLEHLAALQSLAERTAGGPQPIPPRLLDGLKQAVGELEAGLIKPQGPGEAAGKCLQAGSSLAEGPRTGTPGGDGPPAPGVAGERGGQERTPAQVPVHPQESLGSPQEILSYQRRLRALTARMLIAEEQERRRLAVDLHDGLCQTIALTQLKLSTLRRDLEGKPAEDLAEIESLVQQTGSTTRAISFELSPPILHDLGLAPAVRWLVENIQTRYGIRILYEEAGTCEPANIDDRVILFRCLRELLINASKHALARQVTVRLEQEQDMLSVSVEDDGVGMDPEAMMLRGSGLFSIRERLTHVGGRMQITSSKGNGTTIRLWAPLVDSAAVREETT
ncbi:MAG: sensor histidine kinase [Planctomycetes bacterium]|nr:sensor histidine kinase [Planctomycetota bacterium]